MLAEKTSFKTIKEKLLAVDWSFASSCPGTLEGIHPYPAKFIADIPRTLLDILEVPLETYVFDPFCGSGTTLSVAQQAGHSSIGVDLNPIACLISRVKTSPLPPNLEDAAEKVVAGAKKRYAPILVDIPNIDHWFIPEVQYALAAIRTEICFLTDQKIRDILDLALSSIIVKVSNQESDTRYAAVQKNITAEKTYQFFHLACKKIILSLQNRNWNLTSSSVLQANTLELSEGQIPPIGLVITSPPYPNAYEYWLYHKYRMWWLGFDPLNVKKHEIGARAHFFSGSQNKPKQNFSEQMCKNFALLEKVVVPRGYVCFVIGRSKIHGEYIDNAKTIEDISRNMGFEFQLRIDREILATRKSFNLAHAQIKTESILIMQRKKA